MAKAKNNDLLGKGIRSLLGSIDSDLKSTEGKLKEEVVEKTTAINRIPLDAIITNPDQPRKDFDESLLQELASSIRIHDIIQPLTVVSIGNGKYKLVAGERRYRASKLAGLKDVPVYIRTTGDSDILELSLLENLQRENLNAIEVSLAYKRLIDDLNYTQEQVAERMGKERSTVANYVRLLRLPPTIQVAIRNGELTMGHARALVNIDNVDQQLHTFREVVNKGMSVRQTEELVKRLYKSPKTETGEKKESALSPAFQKLEQSIASQFGTRVKMQHQKTGRGSITLEYFSLEELNGLLDKLNITVQ